VLTLAWRNIWRNRRRSLITLVSIASGLAAILFGQSLIHSIQIQLIEKATGIIIGHIQVQKTGVEDPKVPDKPFGGLEEVEAAFARVPGVEGFERRFLLTGLISTPAGSQGALLCGVQPEREKQLFDLAGYVAQGSFPKDGERSVALGVKMARTLDVRLGEKVVIMAQGADGSIGAEAFRVSGIYRTGSQTFDAQIVYLPIERVQGMLGYEGQATNVVAMVRDVRQMRPIREAVAQGLKGRPDLAVLTWEEVDQEIVGIQRYQNALVAIVLAVVFIIVALGILNTLLMSIFERIREFGVLKAIGARPRTLLLMVLAESLLLGLLGTLLGLAAGSAMILHFGKAGMPLPIGEAINYFIPFDTVIFLRFSWERHWKAVLMVFATCVAAGLVPALRAARLKAAEALRHV